MMFWFYLSLALAYLLALAFAGSALMAWLDRQRALSIEVSERFRANEEKAAALLGQFHHVGFCNCGLLFGGAVLRVDARCVCWTWRLRTAEERLQKQNEPGDRPARTSLPVQLKGGTCAHSSLTR